MDSGLGIVVDVSHCSKQTTLDAAVLSTKPIIATHANAKALTPESRNMDDEELLAIAATHGVIGVTLIRWMLAACPRNTVVETFRVRWGEHKIS